MASPSVLLEGMFYMSASKHRVSLTPDTLSYIKVNSQCKEKVVQISDVTGCHASVNSTPPEQQAVTARLIGRSQSNGRKCACFTIFAYPFEKAFFGNRSRRRVSITFDISSVGSVAEDERTALQWTNVLNCLAWGYQPSDVERCVPPPRGRFLVLVNPCSGPGKAMSIFQSQVAPMLQEASIPFKVFVTEYAGHANELMQTTDLTKYAAVVVVSGDGLLYEVINGLMQRVDWSSAIKTPVGCVPGGSGNALVCSISHAAGVPVKVNPVVHATFVLTKQRRAAMDLVLVQTPGRQTFSFLSLTWGLLADIDLQSERYRFMGEARFNFGSIKSIVNVPAYAGKLSFLPVGEYIPKRNSPASKVKKAGSFSGQRSSNTIPGLRRRAFSTADDHDKICADTTGVCSMVEECDGSGTGTDLSGSEKRNNGGTAVPTSAVPVSGESDVKTSQSSAVNATVEHTAAPLTDGTQCVNPASHSSAPTEGTQSVNPASHSPALQSGVAANGHAACSSADDQSAGKGPASPVDAGGEELGKGGAREQCRERSPVPSPLLPPLDQPVGEGWVQVPGRFVMVCAVYQSHIGSDLPLVPGAHLADGLIHLLIVRSGITRRHLLALLLSFSKARHLLSPHLELVPVRAFRLEPGEGSGHFMVDGERLDPVPLQAQVLPGMARVLAAQ